MPVSRPVNPAALKLAPVAAASGDSVPIYDTSAGQHASSTVTNLIATGGANPSATVSGSAVNGTAGTFMRSDAAPALANTTVTPGSYTNASITVDQQGRLTAASSGAASASGSIIATCSGRLTSVSATPDPTTDQASPGTIYWTPLEGGLSVALYDGSSTWTLFEGVTEKSIALSGLTSGKNYDVFVYNNGGTPALELSAAWTNDTTRADALTAQNGVYVKSGATTRRWLGTFRATGTGTTADTMAARYIWNAYNRVPRQVYVHDSTNTWNYDTATIRQANGASANKIEVVCGLTGLGARLNLTACAQAIVVVAGGFATGIGEDSTTTYMASTTRITGAQNVDSGAVAVYDTAMCFLANWPVPTGYHYYAWLEKGGGTGGGTTWAGDDGGTDMKTGMSGSYLC